MPFSLAFCLLGLLSLGDVSRGGGGGGGGGATLSLVGEMASSNQSPRIGSLSSSAKNSSDNLSYILWVKLKNIPHHNKTHMEIQLIK